MNVQELSDSASKEGAVAVSEERFPNPKVTRSTSREIRQTKPYSPTLELSPQKLDHPHHSISKIPLEEIKRLMTEYGPSVHLSQHRDSMPVKEASWKRKFRRWNPGFFDFFAYNETSRHWEPVLGEEEEKERRRMIQEGQNSQISHDVESPPTQDAAELVPPSPTRNNRSRRKPQRHADSMFERERKFAKIKPSPKAQASKKRCPSLDSLTKTGYRSRVKQAQPLDNHSRSACRGKDDGDLYCTVWEKYREGESQGPIGFVILPSQKTSTFTHVRQAIIAEIDAVRGRDWMFHIPRLGPVSHAQEHIFGAVLPFISKRHLREAAIGCGTLQDPLRVYIATSTDA